MAVPALKDVVSELTDPMKDAGFRKRKLNTFTIDLGEDVVGLVMLAVKKYRDYLEFQIFVGVHHAMLERVSVELERVKCDPYCPTVALQLGSLLPHGVFEKRGIARGYWQFEDKSDVAHYVPEIVRAVRDFGLPYIKKHSTLKAIVSTLLKRTFIARTVVGLYLMDQPDDAFSVLEKELRRVAPDTDDGARDTRRFAKRLVAAMQKSGWEFPPKRVATFEMLIDSKSGDSGLVEKVAGP